MREQTLKSVLVLITKLSDRTINGELLKYLARTANDEQPGIRTNTTICLGKIAKNLGSSTRAKVLIAAFTRSLRDPFVHARNASLLALAVTGEYFSEEDCAARILPSICPLLIDKEKLVRDQAIKTMDVYMGKIKKAAAGMPDSVLPPQSTAEQGGGPRMSTPQPETSSSSSASWAGWAISSFTNKLSTAAGDIQTNGTPPPPATVPQQRPPPPTSSASALHRQALKSPPPTMSRTPSSSSAPGDSFFEDPEGAAEPIDDFDAWGDMDEASETTNSPPQSVASSTTLPQQQRRTVSSSATPFDDAEPDFAGWLAAKSGVVGGKGLPKGLAAKTSGGGAAVAKKPAAKKTTTAKPVVGKKIDLKPKAADDDDGWGDGW